MVCGGRFYILVVGGVSLRENDEGGNFGSKDKKRRGRWASENNEGASTACICFAGFATNLQTLIQIW
jgi:hypothetical protein